MQSDRLSRHSIRQAALGGGCILAIIAVVAAAGPASADLSDDPNNCAEMDYDTSFSNYGVLMPSPPSTAPVQSQAAQPMTRAEVLVAEPLPWIDADREAYPDADPEPIRSVADQPVSTFSADVDTASYAVVRRFLRDGMLPPTDAVRVEEMVNYFDYGYPLAKDPAAPFAPSVTVYPSPWNAETQILQIGIRSYDPYGGERPPANLVWLVDISGSMDSPDKLPLVRRSLRAMAAALDGDDTVSIVTYAGSAGVLLPPTGGENGYAIEAAIRDLCPGGSTAGAEGIRTAYELAEENFDPDAVNRVILATDGDFNVGVTDNQRLEDYVARQRATGIYLTVLGYGQGNYQDARMQVLAQAGNGNAAYIDGIEEAEKVLVDELASTLVPVANDVKFQVEFNPAAVVEYRLIGYETRLLERQDFNLDAVDAGDVGANQVVTAMYEIAAPGSGGLVLDPLRYGNEGAAPAGTADELAFLRIRYKLPGEPESRLIERPVTAADLLRPGELNDDARFAAAVAAFAQILRGEAQLAGFGLDDVEALAESGLGDDPRGLRRGFLELVERAERVAP